MSPKLRALARYRPRLLTLAVLFLTAAVLALANLTDDYHRIPGQMTANPPDSGFAVGKGLPTVGGVGSLSYGWPLFWRQYVVAQGYGPLVIGWRYSPARLAGNIAMWLAMLAAPTAACEWVLRRCRPRWRWSLRTMLAAVSLVAAFLGWFVWARDRANAEDALIDAIEKESGQVWLERWGPKWLDLIGADRYRRRIVAAYVHGSPPDYDDDITTQREALGLLQRLSILPNVKYLSLECGELTPQIAAALSGFVQLRMLTIDSQTVLPGTLDAFGDALGRMPKLRVLTISPGWACSTDDRDRASADENEELDNNDLQMRHECLAAVGKATQLEYLRLSRMEIRPESLAGLAGLTNLKLLSLEQFHRENDESNAPPLLSELPALQRLEALEVDSGEFLVGGSEICDDDIRFLSRLPQLRSISLVETQVTGGSLKQLASLKSLEELTLSGRVVSSAALESLPPLKNLRALHLDMDYRQPSAPDVAIEMLPHVGPGELAASLRALRVLRQTHPGIEIDGDLQALSWDEKKWMPLEFETADRARTSMVREFARKWEEAGRPLPGASGS